MIYDIISTGSKGNAVVINNKILIDCGVPLKKLKDVYEGLSIVLLTHKHADHFNKRTIKKLAEERPTLRFACGKQLVPDVVKCGVKKRNIDVVESGKIYDYKAFKISPFTLYHDVENIGWRIFSGGEKAIYATDTKTLDGITAKDYDLYLIEANYTDEELKQRLIEKRYYHSLCVADEAKRLAEKYGGNAEKAYLAGLLHDIGKAVDHEVEGTHIQIGVDLAKKYRESGGVIHCIAAHHNDIDPNTIEAVLVQAADAISGARPGARRETLSNYLKRLEKLEEIANSFPGVEKCFAIQAGREIRIIVKPDQVSEDASVLLAKDIAKRIEDDMVYPGQIKVNVVRETRTVEYAK